MKLNCYVMNVMKNFSEKKRRTNETTSQGLPVYEAKSITGEIYFDKGEFVNLRRINGENN